MTTIASCTSRYHFTQADVEPAHASASSDEVSLQDIGDAATTMFLLMMKSRASSDQCAEQRIDGHSKLKKVAADHEMADRIKAVEARNAPGFFDGIGQLVADAFKGLVTANFDQLDDDARRVASSPNFWGDLQKVAAVVAEVASAVVSGVTLGAASASVVAVTAFVVGTVLSTAAMVEQNFHVLEKLTNDPEFAKYFAIGCMVGSAVCGLTSAVANGLSTVAKEGAKQALSATAKEVKAIAQTTATLGHVVSACAQLPAAAVDYDLAKTDIDAKKQAIQQQVLQRLIGDIIDRLKSQHDESDKDVNAARAAIATEQDTQLIAASMLRA
jgi:hypothetical protein